MPSTFRILRQVLSRLEDERDGRILVDALHAQIPPERRAQAEEARLSSVTGSMPGSPSCREPVRRTTDAVELVLSRTWRPALEITGAGGLPEIGNAGNVARPHTAAKLSLRLPPTCDPEAAAATVRALLECDPPHGARVRFSSDHAAPGWEAPPVAPWLDGAVRRASAEYFGPEAVYMGEGGTIPFMGMLGEEFPRAQFLITGVLGPESNAHGPNEFLHIPTGKRLTCCVAEVIAAHHAPPPGRRIDARPAQGRSTLVLRWSDPGFGLFDGPALRIRHVERAWFTLPHGFDSLSTGLGPLMPAWYRQHEIILRARRGLVLGPSGPDTLPFHAAGATEGGPRPRVPNPRPVVREGGTR